MAKKTKNATVDLEYPVDADQLAALGFDGFGPAESGNGTVGKIANACPLWIGPADKPAKGRQSVKVSTGFRNSLSLAKAVQFADWLHDTDTDPNAVAVVRALAEIDAYTHAAKTATEIATELAAKNACLERKISEMERMLRAGQRTDAAA